MTGAPLQIDPGTLLLIILVVMIIATLIPSLLSSEEKERTARPRVYSELYCPRDGYTETRDFVPGDYVGRKLDEKKCPRCGLPLVIRGIYAVYPEEKTRGRTPV